MARQETASPMQPASHLFGPGGFDPLRWAWSLLANVKFAMVLVSTAVLLGLIGVVLPQVPAPMRGNAAAKAAWLELQRKDYGRFTDVMDRTGLFDVFHTPWFNGVWAVIVVAVTVCTYSRFRPTVRNVHRPVKQVGDAYFETAHHRANFSHPGGAEAAKKLLRKKRYKVELLGEREGATYLFAERYSWQQYGTFLSHLALLMLLIGALLTRFVGFDRTLVIAEGTPAAPVFDSPGPDQIFIKMIDAIRGKDGAGNIVDFRSQIEVRRGEQVVRCETTVNDPCSAFGYKVHQAAFFDDLARLRITGPDGQVIYDDVLDFDSQVAAVPVLKVTKADGQVLFERAIPQLDTDTNGTAAREDDVAISSLAFADPVAGPDPVVLGIAWRGLNGVLRVAANQAGNPPRELALGRPLSFATDNASYWVEFTGVQRIPAVRLGDLPGAITLDAATTVQMAPGPAGTPVLVISGIDNNATVLAANQPVRTPAGYTYTFIQRVEASGVSVRRDPGDTFIWLAVGMALVGLAVTFYVPRRRVWFKITEGRTYVAGVAERTTRLAREFRFLGAELGARDALTAADVERD